MESVQVVTVSVMAGLVPAIHVLPATIQQDVDARDESGHDELQGKATTDEVVP
jgi:hypothetical protein